MYYYACTIQFKSLLLLAKTNTIMSHDTHHAHSTENKAIISFKNSFWLVIILVGLFVAALNFIQVEGKGSEEGHGAHGAATHEAHGGAGHGAEAKDGKHEAAGHEAATHAEDAKPAAEADHKTGH